MSFDLKALWREPSTKRGLVMLITGGAVLYQTIFNDGSVDIAGMESRIERWIGIGMMLAGLLGWLPDAPKEKPDDRLDQTTPLPPINLVGRSELSDPATEKYKAGIVFRDTRYRDPTDDQLQPPSMSPIRSDENGWNG